MGAITILMLIAFCIFFPISLFYSPIAYTVVNEDYKELKIPQFEKILEEYVGIHGFAMVLLMIVLFVSMFLLITKTSKNVAKASFAVSLAVFSYFIYVIIKVFNENIEFGKLPGLPRTTWTVNGLFIALIVFVAILFILNIINFVKQLIKRS